MMASYSERLKEVKSALHQPHTHRPLPTLPFRRRFVSILCSLYVSHDILPFRSLFCERANWPSHVLPRKTVTRQTANYVGCKCNQPFSLQAQAAQAAAAAAAANGGEPAPPPPASSRPPPPSDDDTMPQVADSPFSPALQEELRVAITVLAARLQREKPMSRAEFDKFESAVGIIVEVRVCL